MIFGRPGSGKSTLALKLHQQLGIPLFHLDKYFYTSKWQERNYDEFIALQKSLVAADQWIIDGNSIRSLSMRFQRADLVLFLNYPRWVCYRRVFKRLFTKDANIDDRAEGCHETIRMSLLRYMWNYNERVRPFISELTSVYPHIPFVEINSDRALRQTVVTFCLTG